MLNTETVLKLIEKSKFIQQLWIILSLQRELPYFFLQHYVRVHEMRSILGER